jgi:two-component sensor histidine kinase
LIRLEARTVKPDESGVLGRLAGRIESLALLYQTLSSDRFGSELDLGSYLSQIASAVVRTHTLPGIELELKVIYAPASINVAMPVGLLVNEMLTNAFKYAFTGRDRGTVTIECRYDADSSLFEICVADDGNGMPPNTPWPDRGKLAALIMQTLRENTRDLAFEVVSGPGKGTRIEIAFIHQVVAKVH